MAFLKKIQWVVPTWFLALAVGLTLLNGFASVIAVLLTRFHVRMLSLSQYLPYGVFHVSRTLTLLTGFVLLYFSFHLLRRSRVAWLATIISASVALVAGFVHDAHWVVLAVGCGNVLVLLLVRPLCTVQSEMQSIVRGLAFATGTVLFAILYGVLGLELLEHRDFGIDFSTHSALLHALQAYALLGSDLVPQTRHAQWLLDSLHFFGLTAVLFFVYSLFRPLAYRLRTLPHERAIVAGILHQHSRSVLDYFMLFDDKSYFFSPSYQSVLAYGQARGVAIALGDPCGPLQERSALVASFHNHCRESGWRTAFLQTLPDDLAIYKRNNFSVVKIGDEAMVDCRAFAETTSVNKEFRRIRKNFTAAGFHCRRIVPPHSNTLVTQLAEVSRSWLTIPGKQERGFSLGRFTKEYIASMPVFVLEDRQQHIVAFLSEFPVSVPDTTAFDLMRHNGDVPNGTMDYLFEEFLFDVHARGLATCSFGLAALTGLGGHGAPVQEHIVRFVTERLPLSFSFAGLRRYKTKFHPHWEPRYLVYEGGQAGLLQTAIALTQLLKV